MPINSKWSAWKTCWSRRAVRVWWATPEGRWLQINLRDPQQVSNCWTSSSKLLSCLQDRHQASCSSSSAYYILHYWWTRNQSAWKVCEEEPSYRYIVKGWVHERSLLQSLSLQTSLFSLHYRIRLRALRVHSIVDPQQLYWNHLILRFYAAKGQNLPS